MKSALWRSDDIQFFLRHEQLLIYHLVETRSLRFAAVFSGCLLLLLIDFCLNIQFVHCAEAAEVETSRSIENPKFKEV